MDDDGSDSSPGSPSQASDSPKRQRLNGNHDGDRDTKNGIVGAANEDGFHPGAIIRVSVENFVTYEKADFFPGPNLNMVIGPNGTGKSSLVCAICLGLGYSPKHLGRAGSVKEFVKHGKDTATIEIELAKRPQDRSNFVIRVQIRREQNSQKWWLNGKETTHKKIQSLMRLFKIQVDNLCQFLPQDRVVEFAACTPIDLLRETLRAAAPEEMIEWQGQLRELHKEKKELVADVHGHAETLQNLENRQQGLQADVDRIREREEIQEKVKDLEGALVICKYEDARKRHTEAKERKRREEEVLRQLQDEHGPSLEAVNCKQAYVQRIEAFIPSRERAVREAEMKVSRVASDINTAAESIAEIENNIGAERNGFESKKKNLSLSRSKITAYQADLRSRPADFNAAEWNQRIRAEEHQVRELVAEERQISEQRNTIRDEARKINQAIQVIKDDLESLNTQQGQQLNLLRTHFPDAATAWDWVQEHMDEFEKPVFGPPMITCSIKDERYSDQVQSHLQTDEFTCFTAQTKSDYKKLSDQFYRQLSLSVVVRMCAQPLSSFTPPLPKEQAEAIGLDGFAIEFLEGPAPVLAMLCAEKRLHHAGVSLKDHSDSQYEQIVNSNKVTIWAAGKQSYMVRRRREYGPQAMTTVTKTIPPGRFWTAQAVDEQVQEELNQKLKEKSVEKSNLRDQHTAVEDKLKSLKAQQSELDTKIDQLKSEKAALQKEYQKWQSLPGKIGTIQLT
jgi:recombinational DNA repair ATPase RecF